MIQEKFTEISNELGYHYTYSEKFIPSLGGSNIPISYHKMTAEHKSVAIALEYEFGGHNLAKINSIIPCTKNIANFSILTKSQLKRVFSKDKRAFTISTTDPLFASKLEHILEASLYNDIALKTTFEPEIVGINKENSYSITTTFYVGFDDKEESIVPSIELHKKIIDQVLR